jgi:hypothetical protein
MSNPSLRKRRSPKHASSKGETRKYLRSQNEVPGIVLAIVAPLHGSDQAQSDALVSWAIALLQAPMLGTEACLALKGGTAKELHFGLQPMGRLKHSRCRYRTSVDERTRTFRHRGESGP